ncbi:MCE family protein [Pseudodesulfovibrio sp. F-1]|uniref:MCE family protein n=1 Tax=Pseudodesulfovibrio alkaliphilus TaxID=2661613 RepID=A0A7K1KJ85_9BACT|nr:MlaD family protein [Pseudodesulfovibrio alkaliphilus]MUM76148.1 MCE family protein [Pseudodesulfovibrio alkaliphilus]
MIRKQDYFKLGTFIIVGTAMLLAVIVILGAGRFFSTSFTIETYFNESVNGLEVGSPVKLRGVNIGRVADIDFVLNTYPDASLDERRYVYVICDIDNDVFGDLDKQEFAETIKQEVAHGLRVRPTSLGLTGQLFLNLTYDSNGEAPLTVDWIPTNNYVPAVQSTMNRIEAAITSISKTLSGLSQEDIGAIIKDIKSIVSTINSFIQTEDGKEAGKRILSILAETRDTLTRVNQLLADPAAKRIIPATARAVEGIDRIVAGAEGDVIAAAHDARAAMASFRKASDALARTLADPRLDQAMEHLAPSLENIGNASRDMAAAVSKVHALTNRLNALTASEEASIRAIIDDTREVMENIREITRDAKRYPSGMLFGNPPTQARPETD